DRYAYGCRGAPGYAQPVQPQPRYAPGYGQPVQPQPESRDAPGYSGYPGYQRDPRYQAYPGYQNYPGYARPYESPYEQPRYAAPSPYEPDYGQRRYAYPTEANPAYRDPALARRFAALYGPGSGEAHALPTVRMADLDPAFMRATVNYRSGEAPGTIII